MAQVLQRLGLLVVEPAEALQAGFGRLVAHNMTAFVVTALGIEAALVALGKLGWRLSALVQGMWGQHIVAGMDSRRQTQAVHIVVATVERPRR